MIVQDTIFSTSEIQIGNLKKQVFNLLDKKPEFLNKPWLVVIELAESWGAIIGQGDTSVAIRKDNLDTVFRHVTSIYRYVREYKETYEN